MKKIDLPNWKRKPLFDKFSPFNSPFFNICADVDVTALLAYTKAHGISFFQASYFLVLKTVNAIENFRYRIRDGEVIVLEKVNGSCPILNEDETFTYCIFTYYPDFISFKKHAAGILEKNRNGDSPPHQPFRDDLIHSSVIPWVSFHSFEHAKRVGSNDSNPKVVMGKYYEENGKIKMPLSVAGHHALMDGLHVGLYFKKIQEYMAEPSESLNLGGF